MNEATSGNGRSSCPQGRVNASGDCRAARAAATRPQAQPRSQGPVIAYVLPGLEMLTNIHVPSGE